jgi:hypothetical protein
MTKKALGNAQTKIKQAVKAKSGYFKWLKRPKSD